jgi:hypothetical protein
MLNGYYNFSPEEEKIKVVDRGDYLVSKREVTSLPIGALFTAPNGGWYVKVGSNDYRRWTWLSRN